ncbi:MAG: VRR-NUC domain-containing protein [Candidatus Latescibacterota bacterium]|nr:MAG: VRR-NUC domain-containing protein [Candidatus Latescibacterota bacterium]
MPKESSIKAKIMDWAKTEPDLFVVKIHGNPYMRKGLPDLMGSVGIVAWYCELKRPGKKRTELQKITAKKIIAAGAPYCVAHSLEEFQDFINRCRLRAPTEDFLLTTTPASG